ncbi:hypothetical protein, partial [Oceaniglobus ichthyenteri]|uniref:hypothetical protein n=1 Tax=Oceaniglobus ichthyenteri TaxID=2136177 RepID=UPI00197F17C1
MILAESPGVSVKIDRLDKPTRQKPDAPRCAARSAGTKAAQTGPYSFQKLRETVVFIEKTENVIKSASFPKKGLRVCATNRRTPLTGGAEMQRRGARDGRKRRRGGWFWG